MIPAKQRLWWWIRLDWFTSGSQSDLDWVFPGVSTQGINWLLENEGRYWSNPINICLYYEGLVDADGIEWVAPAHE